MKLFEYKTDTIRFDSREAPVVDLLNDHGEAGWELVAVVNIGDQGLLFYFKRELEQ